MIKLVYSISKFKTSFYSMSFIIGLLIIVSCNSSKGTGFTNTNEIQIIKANQTLIVSGANGIKGKRISLSILVNNGITLDSIQYESYFQGVNLIKTNNDTLFVDAHFYPIRSASHLNDSSNPNASLFTSNDCTLFYHTNQKTKSIIIKDLIVLNDNAKWE